MLQSLSSMRLRSYRHIGFALTCVIFGLQTGACANKHRGGVRAVIVQASSGTGLGDEFSDGYVDSFLTPSLTAIAVQSVALIGSGDTGNFTIFDAGSPDHALRIELTNDPQEIDLQSHFPSGCECTYSKVAYQLAYVEYTIPIYFSGTASQHRIRLYTASYTDAEDLDHIAVSAGDVLIENDDAFHWVNAENGDYVLPDPTAAGQNKPALSLRVPPSRFPGDGYSGPFTSDFASEAKIPKKPKGTFEVKLQVEIGEAFFFDDVDNNGRFDRSPDGNLNQEEPDSHFYPAFPPLVVSAE